MKTSELSVQLHLTCDLATAQASIELLIPRLLEEFPEAEPDLIQDLLLAALDDVSVFSLRPTAGTRNDVVGFEVVLNTSRIVEILAAALA